MRQAASKAFNDVVNRQSTQRLQLVLVLLNRVDGPSGGRSSQNHGVSAIAVADRRNGQRADPFLCFFEPNFTATIRPNPWDCLRPGGPFTGLASVAHHARGGDACQSR